MHEQAPIDSHEELCIIRGRLLGAAGTLGFWHRDINSDSIRRQEERKRDFINSAEVLEEVNNYAKQNGLTFVLRLGSKPMESHSHFKGAYDFINESLGERFVPGAEIPISYTEKIIRRFEDGGISYYFGDYSNLFELSEIAQILYDGGELILE